MENKKVSWITYFINLSFFLYFVILLVERVIALSLSLSHGIQMFDNFYHGFSFLLVILSLVLSVGFLIYTNRAHFKALFTRDSSVFEKINWRLLCWASGIILVSGMIHLDDTNIAGVQFAAYGVLIVGLLLKTIENNKTSKNRFTLWLSFVYLVCFAMAVPVTYPYVGEHMELIYSFEFITMLVLVAFFASFEVKMFTDGADDLFFVVPFIITIALDSTILGLRWGNTTPLIGDANTFVLIFLSATVAVYLVYFAYRCIKKIKNQD